MSQNMHHPFAPDPDRPGCCKADVGSFRCTLPAKDVVHMPVGAADKLADEVMGRTGPSSVHSGLTRVVQSLNEAFSAPRPTPVEEAIRELLDPNGSVEAAHAWPWRKYLIYDDKVEPGQKRLISMIEVLIFTGEAFDLSVYRLPEVPWRVALLTWGVYLGQAPEDIAHHMRTGEQVPLRPAAVPE